MKKPDKPHENVDRLIDGNLQIPRDVLLKGFAAEIIHGNVILLLGHESLLRIPTDEEASQDDYDKALKECKGSMRKWMDYLKREGKYKYEDPGKIKNFYAGWFDNNNAPKLEPDDINPEIRKLLQSKQIRVVLTTTYDPLIEELMKEIWGGEDSITVKNFLDDGDLSSVDRIVLKEDIKPTLYYLFGKATNNRAKPSKIGNPDFVIDEEDYIKTLKEWMKNPPSGLMSYISDKRILAIGCKFDYWLFRFFWRVVLESEQSPSYKHLLAVTLTSSDSDEKLRELFRHYRLKFPDDVSQFLKDLNHTLEVQTPRLLKEERERGGIFLSYCREDTNKALTLFYRLRDKGFKVWMDEKELEPGEQYKESINTAIDDCAVFVPVLSNSITRHTAADPHFYRDVEWDRAHTKYIRDHNSSDTGRKIEIIPFALDGYNPNDFPPEIAQEYPYIVSDTHVLLTYNNASFVKFIASLNHVMDPLINNE